MRHARALIDASASEMARGLLERALSDGARRDDSVAVVIRRSPASERRGWTLTPQAEAIPAVRGELRTWLEDRNIGGDDLDDAALLATELLSNAVAAAVSRISLRAALVEGVLTLEVEDDGAGDPRLEELGHELPEVHAREGRGLFIVRALADDVRTFSTSEGTIVSAARHVGPAPSQSEQAVDEIFPPSHLN